MPIQRVFDPISVVPAEALKISERAFGVAGDFFEVFQYGLTTDDAD